MAAERTLATKMAETSSRRNRKRVSVNLVKATLSLYSHSLQNKTEQTPRPVASLAASGQVQPRGPFINIAGAAAFAAYAGDLGARNCYQANAETIQKETAFTEVN